MSFRGVHFALTAEQEKHLRAVAETDSGESLVAAVEEIEEEWDEEFVQETDKAWDAIHRCLSDGTMDSEAGSYPLNKCIFGGQELCSLDDYYVVLITQTEVKDVAAALQGVTEDWLRQQYWNMAPDYDDPKSDEDFEYTWQYLGFLKGFFQKAGSANRSVIFTVDQ